MSKSHSPTSSRTKISVAIFCRRQKAVGSRQKTWQARPASLCCLLHAACFSPSTGHSRSLYRAAYRLLLTAFCLLPSAFFLSACGKVGDPLPPIPRAPVVIGEPTATQQGNRIILNFPLTRTARSTPVERIDIYRLIEPVNASSGLTEEDFSARSTVIHSILGDQLPASSATITYTDPLDLKSAPPNMRYRYAVRIVNPAGRAGDFSQYALLPLLVEIAQSPSKLNTQLSERQIDITWTPPTANENGAPAKVAGYNIYRRSGGALVKLNAEPLGEPRFVDRKFQFGATYEYFVRSLSLSPASAKLTDALESNDSAAVTITPKDTFPPSAPTAVTLASINGVVSLFWPANPEPDVAGYNLYRSEDENAPPATWLKLNPQLRVPITFRDERVQVGKRYCYQITAVDTAGNESARSETKCEVVNP